MQAFAKFYYKLTNELKFIQESTLLVSLFYLRQMAKRNSWVREISRNARRRDECRGIGKQIWTNDLTIFSSLFTSHPSGRYSPSSHILALLHNLRRIKEPVLTILCWLPKHQRWLFYCISAWEAAFSFAQRADVLFERSNEGLQIWSSGCVVSRPAASKWNWVWSQEVWGTAERTWRTKKETKHSQQLSTGVTAFNFIF